MLRLPSIAIAVVVWIAAALSLTLATTLNKITYDQAWEKCKAHIDKIAPWDQHTTKTSTGTTCILNMAIGSDH